MDNEDYELRIARNEALIEINDLLIDNCFIMFLKDEVTRIRMTKDQYLMFLILTASKYGEAAGLGTPEDWQLAMNRRNKREG